MNVVIADYQPNVKCAKGPPKGPSWDSCYHIFADMKADQNVQVFGSRSDPRAKVKLPFDFKSSELMSCMFVRVVTPFRDC